MQSQPNHIEILAEKNSVDSIIRPVAAEFCIPMTIGRGYCSLRPRFDVAQRFRKSGKERLVLLMLSDFDPDGEEIAHSFARSMRDDFGVENIEPIKVALTADQVADYDLPPMMQAKSGSSNYERFAEKHGDDVWELEALPAARLQDVLHVAIDDVLDTDAFNHEIDQEKADAAKFRRCSSRDARHLRAVEGRRRVGRSVSPDSQPGRPLAVSERTAKRCGGGADAKPAGRHIVPCQFGRCTRPGQFRRRQESRLRPCVRKTIRPRRGRCRAYLGNE